MTNELTDEQRFLREVREQINEAKRVVTLTLTNANRLLAIIEETKAGQLYEFGGLSMDWCRTQARKNLYGPE